MRKSVVITVNPAQLDQLQPISERLRQQGVSVNNVLPFGVITGHMEEDQMAHLEQDDAITSVNLDQTASVGD